MSQPNRDDTLLVTNIDTDCHEIEEFAVEQSVAVPPQPGEVNPLDIPMHRTERVQGSFDHSEYFQVRYNGQPFRIAPGATRPLPRYIAEHYAKHLADHILTKMEDAERLKAIKQNRTPKVGFLQSSTLRPQVLNQILKVGHLLYDDGMEEPIVPMAPDMPGVKTTDLGHVPNYAMGELKAQPKTAEEILGIDVPDEPEVTTEPVEIKSDKKATVKLVKEAVKLGIEVTGHETEDELKSKIRAFAGV